MIRNTKNLKGKRILIYGGSFDPVHKGHIHLLKLAIKKIKPNLIFIIPLLVTGKLKILKTKSLILIKLLKTLEKFTKMINYSF